MWDGLPVLPGHPGGNESEPIIIVLLGARLNDESGRHFASPDLLSMNHNLSDKGCYAILIRSWFVYGRKKRKR